MSKQERNYIVPQSVHKQQRVGYTVRDIVQSDFDNPQTFYVEIRNFHTPERPLYKYQVSQSTCVYWRNGIEAINPRQMRFTEDGTNSSRYELTVTKTPKKSFLIHYKVLIENSKPSKEVSIYD